MHTICVLHNLTSETQLSAFLNVLSGLGHTAEAREKQAGDACVFFLADPKQPPKQIPEGVHDVFFTDDAPEKISARVAMRIREAVERADLVKRVSNEGAKLETTVRQREEFLGVCAHDLRSPIGIIQGSIGLLLKQDADRLTPAQIDLLNRAKRQSAHALTLIHDLLDVMALEQGLKPQYQAIRLHDFLSDFHKDYQFQADQKGIQFHYENPIPDWHILGDTDRMRQLFQNLVTNAIKFTETGKNIYLKVTPFQGRRKDDPAYPMIVISLKDEGKGIPQNEMEKIFDRFSQVKTQQRAEGRGLGLTVAKQISNLHDGNVWVESQEGKGSTFHVLFPHVMSQWKVPAPSAEASKKVLIVEPSLKRRKEFFGELAKWGYTVLFAKDGVEAVTVFYHATPRILVLTERLDKLDEKEVAAIIKSNQTSASLPVLLATETIDSKSSGAPFDALLEIPFSKETFEATALRQQPARKKKAA